VSTSRCEYCTPIIPSVFVPTELPHQWLKELNTVCATYRVLGVLASPLLFEVLLIWPNHKSSETQSVASTSPHGDSHSTQSASWSSLMASHSGKLFQASRHSPESSCQTHLGVFFRTALEPLHEMQRYFQVLKRLFGHSCSYGDDSVFLPRPPFELAIITQRIAVRHA
jgi:hypothetical protein